MANNISGIDVWSSTTPSTRKMQTTMGHLHRVRQTKTSNHQQK